MHIRRVFREESKHFALSRLVQHALKDRVVSLCTPSGELTGFGNSLSRAGSKFTLIGSMLAPLLSVRSDQCKSILPHEPKSTARCQQQKTECTSERSLHKGEIDTGRGQPRIKHLKSISVTCNSRLIRSPISPVQTCAAVQSLFTADPKQGLTQL